MRVSRSISLDVEIWEFIKSYAEKNNLSVSDAVSDLIKRAQKTIEEVVQ